MEFPETSHKKVLENQRFPLTSHLLPTIANSHPLPPLGGWEGENGNENMVQQPTPEDMEMD